jgi:hypothetical protein
MEVLYTNWHINLLVAMATAVTVALVVLLHYEGLVWLSARMQRNASGPQRSKVLYGIYVLLAMHVAEIWIFGILVRLLLNVEGAGHVVGMQGVNLMDAVYLSAITFTTVGFGDLVPVGALRFVTGTEALTGLMLITWSASFTYIEMEKFWRGR